MFVLSEIFGDCPQVRIVEAFVENFEEELTVPEISDMTNLAKATVYKHIEKLEFQELILKKRKIGRTWLYQLNLENPKAIMLSMLENYIVSEKLKDSHTIDLSALKSKSIEGIA